MAAMKRLVGGLLAVAATVSASPVDLVERQATGTSPDAAAARTTTLCGVSRPGSVLVRDTIYLDGGYGVFTVKSGNGDSVQEITNPEIQEIFSVNLTQPWSTASLNISQVVKRNRKYDQTFYLPVMDGHMLSNDYQLVLFGGTMVDTDAITNWPKKETAMSKDIYPKPPVPLLDPGQWRPIDMKSLHRGLVGGAYVSAPSEDLAFVFGGSRTTSGEDARSTVPRDKNNANVLSDNLIVLDLSTMKEESWSNLTLPKEVRRRSEGELVWLPVGEQGTLVALGGSPMTWNETMQKKEFPQLITQTWQEYGASLMSKVDLYDVKNDKWYIQETTGDVPPPTAHFCTVSATSEDGSVHNIYAYGGTTGLTIGSTHGPKSAKGGIFPADYYDHVYVLSLPSFVWTRLYTGESSYARRGHRCHRVSDDKMMILGGVSNNGASGTGCVKGDFVRVFDMSEGKMLDKYDPAAAGKYKVPGAVQTMIKGKETGGSTMVPSKWDNDDIPKLFSTKYPKAIKNYWPFPVVEDTSTEGPGGNITIIEKKGDNGLPKYLAPLLGAVLGLLALVSILCLILFYLKKKKEKTKHLMSDSAATEAVNRRRTWSWLIGTQDEKGRIHDEFGEPFHGTEGTETYDGSTVTGPLSPIDERSNPLHGHYQFVNEAPEGEIYEMPVGHQASELPTPDREHTRKTVTINEEPYTMGSNDHPTSPLSPPSNH